MADNGVELVWEGKRRDVERVALPFQRVEVVNESRATRQAGPLLRAGAPAPEGGGATPWRNKLIWGDNKYVLASLIEGDPSSGLEPLAGKVDLIYIDPPFATGSDFSFTTAIGDSDKEVTKEQSVLEETAYRDTWGKGTQSYLSMMYTRLWLMRSLLSPTGSIYVQVDGRLNSAMRMLMDEVFGPDNFRNEVAWVRTSSHNDAAGQFGRVKDSLLYYGCTKETPLAILYTPYDDEYIAAEWRKLPSGRYYKAENMLDPRNSMKEFDFHGTVARWRTGPEKMDELWNAPQTDVPNSHGRIKLGANGHPIKRCRIIFLDEMPGVPLSDVWSDIPYLAGGSSEALGYKTQKPESLLKRILEASSPEGGLVADLFSGSGTTAAVAEKLGRRWIGCDLGRFAIHTTRKRLLGIEGCKPFEVLNLGRYERRYWQGINAGEAVYEYFQFIVRLYHAEPVGGFTNLHGRKGEAMVHVGATDAPVTVAEVRAAMEECKANGLTALDVLGWEWEMGLNSTGLLELQQQTGVAARLFHIPHEVMDKRAVAAGDVHFYEAAYVAAKAAVEAGRAVRIELTDFLVAIDDYIREKVGDKVKKWSDWIDYWAVDFEYNGDVFHNQWQAYRTRKEPKLELTSGAHTYESSGKRQVLVKVVDIFGNDTTALLEVEV